MITATTSYTVLATYTAGRHQRQLVAERLGAAHARVVDAPQHAEGETYIVENLDLEFDDAGALQALVTEYLAHAAELDAVPMATSFLRDYLDSLANSQAA